jgi:hypothetical protein
MIRSAISPRLATRSVLTDRDVEPELVELGVVELVETITHILKTP